MATPKQQAHQRLDRLDASQLKGSVRLGQVMTDPVARSLASAPLDDEPLLQQETAEIASTRAALDRGEGIANATVLADFGLSQEDFDRMGRRPVTPSKAPRQRG